MLSEAGGDILEDEELINTLSARYVLFDNFSGMQAHLTILAFSKVTSREISAALEAAEKTEAVINETRMGYKPYAVRGSLLFFCVADLRNIEPMYQASFIQSIWFFGFYTNSEILMLVFTRMVCEPICGRDEQLGAGQRRGEACCDTDRLLYLFSVSERLQISL